jgi:Fe-S-cluster containining protein
MYRQLIEGVDELTSQLNERYLAHLQCGAGCSGCCQHHLSVFAVEANVLTEAIGALPEAQQTRIRQQAEEVKEREAKGEAVACPLLVDNLCSVYESRPLICRTQGLPLLYEADDGAQEIDFCPLNFDSDAAIAELQDEHLVPLDLLNLKLAMANVNYCRAEGLMDEQSYQRIQMSAVILAAEQSG